MKNILYKSWMDFLHPKMILLNILPVLLSFLLLYMLWMYFMDSIIAILTGFLPISWREYIDIHSIIGTFIKAVLYLCAFFAILLLALVVNVFVSIFYVPLVARYVRKKHYPHIMPPSDKITLQQSFVMFGKMLIVLAIGLVVCLPLLFIPIIGAFAMNVPYFIFFYKTMFFDVGTEILGQNGYTQITQTKGRFRIAFLAYVLNFIPIVHFFTPLLQVLIFTHFCLQYVQNTKTQATDKSQ
ncbi:EI24 domain-containing protein [uncultured Helicobacter sp.]|uniref:EI24 domain-containing protein n=1 Tax=uncultured Helicobacter sp. TaxID=175537 RepID=UPI00374FD297